MVRLRVLAIEWRWCGGRMGVGQVAVVVKWHCCKPPRDVPYKCTYVLYNGTFGASDQGQTLDM